MQTKYYLLLAVLILHLYIAIKVIITITKTPILSKKQKLINSIGVVLVPFIWAIFLQGAIKDTPGYCDAPGEVPIADTSVPEQKFW